MSVEFAVKAIHDCVIIIGVGIQIISVICTESKHGSVWRTMKYTCYTKTTAMVAEDATTFFERSHLGPTCDANECVSNISSLEESRHRLYSGSSEKPAMCTEKPAMYMSGDQDTLSALADTK